MDAHTFGSHISEIRDGELSLQDSWFTRHGHDGAQPDFFHLWTLVPFEKLTVDDLIWALVAAALNPIVSHLVLYVFPASSSDPKGKIDELVAQLTQQHFCPFDFDWRFNEADGDQILVFSVFSEKEAYRVQDLYYPH